MSPAVRTRTRLRLPAATLVALLTACAAAPAPPFAAEATAQQLLASLPERPYLLLGEQHDAPEHQQLAAAVVTQWAAQGRLAAVVLEMAPRGGSTAALARNADVPAIRSALRWDDGAWPWDAYGPLVLAAVRAGVPVLGGNLPRAELRDAMKNEALDGVLAAETRQKHLENVRIGHCDLLPASQLAPMARVQVARDRSMAQVLREQAADAARSGHNGQAMLLITGNVHADATLGVPLHLPQGSSTSIRLAPQAPNAAVAGSTPGYERTVTTPPTPPQDYCARLRQAPAGTPAPGKASFAAPAGAAASQPASAPAAATR